MKDIIHTSPPEHAFVKTICGMFPDMDNLEGDIHAVTARKADIVPASNIYETDTAYIIDMALPGYQRADILLSRRDDMLTIQAASHAALHKRLKRFFRQEFTSCSFTRTFLLPDDAGKATARLADGVLCIKLEKSTQAVAGPSMDKAIVIQ